MASSHPQGTGRYALRFCGLFACDDGHVGERRGEELRPIRTSAQTPEACISSLAERMARKFRPTYLKVLWCPQPRLYGRLGGCRGRIRSNGVLNILNSKQNQNARNGVRACVRVCVWPRSSTNGPPIEGHLGKGERVPSVYASLYQPLHSR